MPPRRGSVVLDMAAFVVRLDGQAKATQRQLDGGRLRHYGAVTPWP